MYDFWGIILFVFVREVMPVVMVGTVAMPLATLVGVAVIRTAMGVGIPAVVWPWYEGGGGSVDDGDGGRDGGGLDSRCWHIQSSKLITGGDVVIFTVGVATVSGPW